KPWFLVTEQNISDVAAICREWPSFLTAGYVVPLVESVKAALQQLQANSAGNFSCSIELFNTE
ncbi:MAG: hypothetical protein ABJA67_16880, partial [Chthonomonadales bacterium]